MKQSVIHQEVAYSISDKRRILEMLAVVLTASGKFVFMDLLEWRFQFITTVMVLWLVYIIYRRRKVKDIFKYWGLNWDNFRPAILKVLPFAVFSIVTCLVIGYFRNSLNLTWHIIPVLILYPIWGTIQQLLTMALVAGNLKDLKIIRLKNSLIILITALLFGALHFPYYRLVMGTFVLALFYGYVYLKVRNVYVLGILHGWLGAFFYYMVLGRDSYQEIFGPLLQNLN